MQLVTAGLSSVLWAHPLGSAGCRQRGAGCMPWELERMGLMVGMGILAFLSVGPDFGPGSSSFVWSTLCLALIQFSHNRWKGLTCKAKVCFQS